MIDLPSKKRQIGLTTNASPPSKALEDDYSVKQGDRTG